MPKMNVSETSDILKPDVIIAVMGATGSGKSTFINLISGSKLCVGTDLNSCTSVVDATAPFAFQDRRVVLFDTPGFDDTTQSDTDILKLVAKFLANTYQNGAILSGVIYMHRISDVRMGGISRRNFGTFRKLCGDKSLKNVAIVTTFWSEVDPAVGDARETELRSDDMFFKPALDKEAKLLRHDGTLDGARKIVAEIMDNRPMALRIQEEMVDENKSLVDTAAGTELNREAVEEKRKDVLQQVQDNIVAAMEARDEESRKELQMVERTDFLKLAANQDEERAHMAERLADMTTAAKESTAQMKELQEQIRVQEQIRAQEQQRSNAERDTAQKELAGFKQRHEAERKQETQMKELQEMLRAQGQQRFNEQLADMKRQLKIKESSNAAHVQDAADARRNSQAAIVAAERSREELAKSKQELQSSKSALVQEAADARQKSQAVAAAAETELAIVKRQLDVMEASNAALDAREKSLMQEASDARQQLQAATEVPVKWLADFLLNDRQVPLHDLYKMALLSVGEWKAGDTADTCRRILGIIIISQAPLADVAIMDLLVLGQEAVSACRTALRRLDYAIEWSEGQSARILHQSFSDYLTDQSACSSEPWFIEVKEHQRALTLACLRIMNEGLHFNMGDLKTSYIANADVPGLAWQIDADIPECMSYACQFWGHHLRKTSVGDPSFQTLILQFFEVKFLYWLEVLSLLEEMPLASRVLVSVMEHVANPSNKVYAFAQDALKFVGAFAPAMAYSTPHIYLSCVPFAPRGSLIKQQYTRTLQNILIVESDMDENWPALQQVFEGHTQRVRSVAFSSDGQRIASGSDDKTVRVCDVKTGTLIAGPFKGHTSSVYSVAFSLDGQRIASGSHDNTIRIWDAKTGALVAGPFTGHTETVWSAAFSPDGQRIASGSNDKTIRICAVKTGTLVAGPFKGHTAAVCSVAFSPDGQRIVSGSSDKTARICDVKTGTLIAGPFKGHTSSVYSVAFSPDGQRIVSGSRDNTIRIWDAKTGALVAGPFTGHTKTVWSAAFSPDGQRIASGSDDKTIRIWDVKTGTLITSPFEGHTGGVNSVAYSPDSQRIASGADDNTVRIWDAATGPLVAGPFEGRTASVNRTSSSRQQHSDAHNRLGGHSELENGWTVNSSGGLLFYVPYAHRPGLWWRYDMAVTSATFTCLNLTRFVHGEDWVRCHV